MTQTRRRDAILAADVAGYSRLIGSDEGGTLQALKATPNGAVGNDGDVMVNQLTQPSTTF
jgi:hypothetical protein